MLLPGFTSWDILSEDFRSYEYHQPDPRHTKQK